MAPQLPEPANGSRKAKTLLDVPEPALATMLEQYCDLRCRGFAQTKIRTKLGWPRHYPGLLLAEAANRGRPGSEESQAQAVDNWLLSMFDAGVEHSAIRQVSALTDRQIKRRLKHALDTASSNPPNGLIIPTPDGTPGRVSWLEPNGRLMHRPFAGAFPARYPAEAAQEQCRDVFIQLLDHPEGSARERAHTMLTMAEDGLHTFDHEVGRRLYDAMHDAGMDDDVKRNVVLKLHEYPHVQQIFLQRCGISPRWLNGKQARSLVRRTRQYGHSPAFTRRVVEFVGHDPDAYYMIGVEHRIPEPTPEARAKCVQSLLDAGSSQEAVETGLATLGVPPGGHHPPEQRR